MTEHERAERFIIKLRENARDLLREARDRQLDVRDTVFCEDVAKEFREVADTLERNMTVA